MSRLSIVKTVLRELTTVERSSRVIEPDLVMDDPDKVSAYTRAGLEDGVMAPVYLFHCAQICEVIRPGDTVVDLACGPATQLGMVARLNPETHFIGVDLSAEMLNRAEDYIAEQGLKNIELKEGSIINLSMFEDATIDAITSTVALHHLPDFSALEQTFSEIKRILKPQGGLYLVDFGHLKSEVSINEFAYQYVDRQAELFTLDYLYSLRAAFNLEDFRYLAKKYLKDANCFSTFLMPYMVAIKTPPRRKIDNQVERQIRQIKDNLPDYHKQDLNDLVLFFRFGGLKSLFL